jgi:rhamnosyltransferase
MSVRLEAGCARVLVLLAAYNGAKYIGQQIISILDQTSVDLRLVVRDDGSSDSTVEEVCRFAEADARVVLMPGAIGSGSPAQNFFSMIRDLDADDFDFVAFSDQDDIWNADKLGRAVEFLAGTDASVYSSAVLAVWPTGKSMILSQKTAVTESDFLFEGAGQGCTFVLRREFYQKLRAFLIDHRSLTHDIRFHDWATYALARSWNLHWAFNEVPTMSYRQHAGNDTGARSSISGVVRRMSRIREGWYRTQLYAIAAICATSVGASPVIGRWHEILREHRSFRRRLRIAAFCLKGGRRRATDNLVLIISALAGWI